MGVFVFVVYAVCKFIDSLNFALDLFNIVFIILILTIF